MLRGDLLIGDDAAGELPLSSALIGGRDEFGLIVGLAGCVGVDRGEQRVDVQDQFLCDRVGGRLREATRVVPQVNQIRCGATCNDPTVVSRLAQRGVELEVYGPFKVSNLHDPMLVSLAVQHDATTAQVIVAWHMRMASW